MKAKGKQLESEIKKYLVKNNIFHTRLLDSSSAGKARTAQIADFIFFPKIGRACILEAKECDKESIPLTNFRPRQLQAMRESQGLSSCDYYIIVKSKDVYNLIFSRNIVQALDDNDKRITLWAYVQFPRLDRCMDYLIEHELV